MAVIVKYVVERNGAEKMTFTSKAQADAYDKMLDTADELTTVLAESTLLTDDNFGNPFIRAVIVINLIAIDEHDEIRILFN